MKRSSAWMVLASLGVCTLGLVSLARADEKASATGTWTWEFKRPNSDEPIKISLKLKQEGEKLTGALSGPGGNETEIKEGSLKDGKVSFQVTRERNGNSFTTKYHGTITGDTIKGKADTEIGGEVRSRDWEAKRS
jgi:hypothetical protein